MQHNADLRTQGFDRHIAHVDVVNFDGAIRWIPEARDQVDDGGLACAGRANDSNRLTGFSSEVDILQNRLVFFVGRGDMLEFHFADDVGHGFGIRAALHTGDFVQEY